MNTEPRAMLRLINWVSPALPTGGFSYSHGLEQAVDTGLVMDRNGLRDWLTALLVQGSGWNDAVVLAETWRTATRQGDCRPLVQLAEAMAQGAERHLETMAQGRAFLTAASAWQGASPTALPMESPLPVAIGAYAGWHNIPLRVVVPAFLNGFVSNLVQVAQRLMPLGQQGGVDLLAAMEPVLLDVSANAAESTLKDLGGFVPRSDMASLCHETKHMRMFRT